MSTRMPNVRAAATRSLKSFEISENHLTSLKNILKKSFKILNSLLKRAEEPVDVMEVADVVAEVSHRAFHYRRQPNETHAQLLQEVK